MASVKPGLNTTTNTKRPFHNARPPTSILHWRSIIQINTWLSSSCICFFLIEIGLSWKENLHLQNKWKPSSIHISIESTKVRMHSNSHNIHATCKSLFTQNTCKHSSKKGLIHAKLFGSFHTWILMLISSISLSAHLFKFQILQICVCLLKCFHVIFSYNTITQLCII